MAEGFLQTVNSVVRDARQMIRPLEHDIVRLLQELVKTNSVAIPPDGSETAAQQVLQDFLQAHDILPEMYDLEFLTRAEHPYRRVDRRYLGRHNLIARIEGNGSGKSLMLSGHIDTVPPGHDPWTDCPWSGVVKEGRLYGRGSYDMKGGLAAAFSVAVALKAAGVRLNGDLFCESVVDEEWGGGGGTLAGRLRGDVADACVIPEPTDLNIFRASRGGYVVDIEVKAGDSQNYFSKDQVVSPAIPLGRLLGWIDQLSLQRKAIDAGETYRGFSDPAPVQVLAVEAKTFDLEVPWSVPLMARARVYFQFLPHEDVSVIVTEIKESFDAFCEADPFFSNYKPEWKPLFDPPLLGHELARDHEWTKTLSACAASVIDPAPVVTAAEYPCDAFLNQNYFGMPTLIFGPRGGGAHNVDEYVEIESVIQTAEVLLATALTWCGT
jgi:acetylornithine deacetylase